MSRCRRGAILCLLAHLLGAVGVPGAEAARTSGSRLLHLQLTVPVRQSPWYPAATVETKTPPGFLSPLLAHSASEPTYADSLRVSQVRRRGGGNTLGVLLSGLGIFAGIGLAAYFKSQADGYYNEYQVIADPQEAQEAFDNAERYDRATLVGWVFAQLSFLSLIYFLTKQGQRDLIPVEGEPLVGTGNGSILVGFRYTP